MAIKKKCPCCTDEYVIGTQILDAVICNYCASMLENPRATDLATARRYYNINVRRQLVFKKTTSIKLPLAKGLIIDGANKLFYIGSADDYFPLYFGFDEVAGYEINVTGGQTVTTNRTHIDTHTNKKGNEKTVTKRKGVLTRGLIGGALFGPLGAGIGALTAKSVEMSPKGKTHTRTNQIETITSETKVVGETKVLTLVLDSPYGQRLYKFTKYPDGITAFLDRCTAMHDALPAPEPMEALPAANEPRPDENDRFAEVRRYKELLDEGIITQEEFEQKRRELLGL